ncbi:DNA repair protein RAD50 [Pectinophora gossypiella]|uniref:DNA repair protein RAD50 n=1 Tax=Pectinophora gossypiella TaxID=13191 RepID=UPI00214F5365|nr:DNA repair protein RAD50 [Pectinophora gossypiella]
MADIKTLAVRGIRSFGPDENDEQRISFEKPLTLILGQNGCGKTTIIECLRYAITGQMPPGSRNECFVHDAKVNRSTEVLGQVKLKIMNAKDKQLEVSRTMKVTALAKKKTKFQTLDSFLSMIDERGNTKDISSRCADLDFIMNEELGVSKAILNSVIFCHQEDSSWPLDEGKKVKERFDEIFDADKYSDCFDRLRKLRKDYIQNLKLLELEVTHLTEKKQELDKRKLEVVNTETSISETELKISELNQELKPISEKLTAIETLQKNLVQWESKKDKIKNKLEHNKTQEEELKKAIKTIFEGTLEELQGNISNYESTGKAKQKELTESYKKITSFNKDEEKIANEKTSNEMKYNKLIFLESQNQERIDKRNKVIVETCKIAGLETPETIDTNEEAEKGISDLTDKVKSLKAELKEMKQAADAEEKKYQQVVNETRDAFTRHKQKISNKEVEIATARKDINKLEKQITDAHDAKTRLELLEQKLNDAEEEYKQADSELNAEECQQEINEDEKVLDQHEQERDELAEKITKLQKHSAKLKERDLLEDQLKQKEKQFGVLQNKHRTALTDILGEMPVSNFAMSVNKLEAKVKGEVDAMKKKLKANDKELTKLETERNHVREMLKDRRSELTKAEDKMYQACGTQTYEATLSKLTSSVEKLQEEQNILQSSMHIFAKYKNQLKDNSCCPLCNRGFENETEVTDLISHLTSQVMNVPAKLEEVTEELQRTSAKKDELLGLKTLNEKITSLKENDIPQLETRLSDVDKKISDLQEAMEQVKQSMKEPEQKQQTAKQIQGEMPLLDKFVQEIKTATRDFESAKSQCEGVEMDMTVDEATAKQAELKQKITTLKARIKATQSKLNQHSKKMRQMADKKNKIKEELLNIQKKVQEIVNLQENKKQIEENRERFVKELQELQDGVAPLEAELREKESEKNNIVNKNRSSIELKNLSIQNIVNSFDKVKSIDSEIRQHKERNIQREMDKIKEANEKLMEKQKQIMIDRDALTKRIDTLKDELAKQEIYKRDLEDNLKLRKAQTEIENCAKEEAEINEKLSGVNTEMLEEKGPLITQQTKLFREKAQNEGLMQGYQERLKQLRNELKKSQNKDIEKKFREKFYELQVTKTIDKDIQNYAVALEKCLMEFHREKMEHINLIIREMWRKIYRGNDIDYIEIKTEGSMSTESDRRKYDYRVVQCKNGVEIDMRGRCSAGQKVLACLIIRLALAETFSSRFGILALDEPTTNLDHENVRSLCSALGEIVQERMRQKNFMFIIITHDKEFIESLGNIDKVTHYYEVSRNEDGKSRIKRIRFS